MRLVSFGVAQDFSARERRPYRVLAGRVADHAGEIADQEYHVMAKLLQLSQLIDQHSVSEMKVGRARIETRLHA